MMTSSTSLHAPLARYATQRNPARESYGPLIEAVHLTLTGLPFMPWQREVCDVAFEHDEAGLLVYRYLVLIVPRQAGKSSLAEAVLVWNALRHRDRTIIYTAQTREMARRRIIEELEQKRLARSRFAGRYSVRRSVGQEQVLFENGSRISLVATTADAGHGLTIDLAAIDEAWAQTDFALIDALDPAMVTRPDPMFVLLSTVGDGSDALLMHYQQLGRASVEGQAPGTGIAFFEWSAHEDEPVDDPAVWWRTHPALGHTITEERLRNRLHTYKPEKFARHFLCRRPSLRDSAVFDPRLWQSRGHAIGPVPEDEVAIALDIAPDRSSATIAVAAETTRGGSVVVVDRRLGTDWVAEQVAALVQHRRVLVGAVDGRSSAASLLGEVEQAAPELVWRQLSTADVVSAAGQFYDAVRAEPGQLWHCAQPDLDKAVLAARKRPVGEAWTWGRRGADGDVTPLVAATLARFALVEHQREHAGGLFIW